MDGILTDLQEADILESFYGLIDNFVVLSKILKW